MEFVRRKLTESRRQDVVQGEERMKVAGREERMGMKQLGSQTADAKKGIGEGVQKLEVLCRKCRYSIRMSRRMG